MQENGSVRAWDCMDEVEKTETILHSPEQELHPAVKSWLTNVFVPAMVKQYLKANIVTGDGTSSAENEE